MPPLVGWAAVTGNLSPLAWGLFAIVFAWTPPHFWALALLKQGEYTRAAVPMLPVVRGEAETRRQIVIYTALLMGVCLALAPLGLGAIYLAAAIALNGVFLWYAMRLYRDPSKKIARQMFFYSSVVPGLPLRRRRHRSHGFRLSSNHQLGQNPPPLVAGLSAGARVAQP